MGWEILVSLIIKEGLPVAAAIFQKWKSGNPPSQADFDELRAMAKQQAVDRIKLQLVSAGIPLDSPQAVALLAMAQ